jgi:hypothetical protein
MRLALTRCVDMASISKTAKRETEMDTHADIDRSGSAYRGVDNKEATRAHREGPVARSIEEQTAKLPSDLFLWAALGSVFASAALQFAGRRGGSLFVGQWAPTILVLGLYNKIVKVAGSDRAVDRDTLH